MKWKLVCFAAGVCALGFVAACEKKSATPSSPSSAGVASADATANDDGSTLKADKPTLQSPANGSRPEAQDPLPLTVTNAKLKFGTTTLTYRFQVFNAADTMIAEGVNVPEGASTTTYQLSTANLIGDQTYSWQARAEGAGGNSPWSDRFTFVAAVSDGYIRGAELYDPLVNGKTVGNMNGPMSFIPGQGLRFFSQLSHVSYVLPQTLTEGEFSLIVSGMDGNTDGGKTKLFAMAQGFGDIVTNDRRVTVEKRGDPFGVVAWRFISHGDQIDTEGAERQFVSFSSSRVYFWKAEWRNNFFNVLIKEGGVDGQVIYSKGKHFAGRAYDPNPHVIYLGAPVGRSGEDGASVDNVTYRQIWVSANPRPPFANK